MLLKIVLLTWACFMEPNLKWARRVVYKTPSRLFFVSAVLSCHYIHIFVCVYVCVRELAGGGYNITTIFSR